MSALQRTLLVHEHNFPHLRLQLRVELAVATGVNREKEAPLKEAANLSWGVCAKEKVSRFRVCSIRGNHAPPHNPACGVQQDPTVRRHDPIEERTFPSCVTQPHWS